MTAKKAPPHDTRPDGEPLRWMGRAVTREQFDANIRDQEAIKATARRNREAQAAAERAERERVIAVVQDEYGVDFEIPADPTLANIRIGERLAANDRRRAEEAGRAAVAAGLAEIAAHKGEMK